MMPPKITATGARRRSAKRRAAASIGGAAGAASGFRRAMTMMTVMNEKTAMRPGMTAAWNIWMIEPSTIIA